jgi:hypothetical protein
MCKTFWDVKPEVRDHSEDLSRNSSKYQNGEIGCEVVDWFIWLRIGNIRGPLLKC